MTPQLLQIKPIVINCVIVQILIVKYVKASASHLYLKDKATFLLLSMNPMKMSKLTMFHVKYFLSCDPLSVCDKHRSQTQKI